MKNNKVSRIILDSETTSILHDMVMKLKSEGQFLSLTHSRLACWIMKEFYRTNFSKEKSRLLEIHFNHKAYLRDVILHMKPEEDPNDVIQNALIRVKRAYKEKPKPKSVDESEKDLEVNS